MSRALNAAASTTAGGGGAAGMPPCPALTQLVAGGLTGDGADLQRVLRAVRLGLASPGPPSGLHNSAARLGYGICTEFQLRSGANRSLSGRVAPLGTGAGSQGPKRVVNLQRGCNRWSPSCARPDRDMRAAAMARHSGLLTGCMLPSLPCSSRRC